MALNDGRSVAFAIKLAKAFENAVPRPHLATDIREPIGYDGPASFEVAMIDKENGKPNGRFAEVTIKITRDGERAGQLQREIEDR